MGTTVDCQDRVANAEKAFAKMGGGIKWLSIEPMLTPLKFKKLELFNWVVIGGASKSSQTPEWVPPLDWVVDLHKQARDAGCAIYYKDNMKLGDDLRIKEFPWEESSNKSLPDSMKYLNIK
jgi:protein gp37